MHDFKSYRLNAVYEEAVAKDQIREDLEKIPKQMGIYMFVEKSDHNKVVYVGSAVGADGLFKRIVLQHLNPGYLESRQDKWSRSAYPFQASNPKNHNGALAVDKSSFRKHIGEYFKLLPGFPTVQAILERFDLKVMTTESKSETLELESNLIASLSPIFNTKGK